MGRDAVEAWAYSVGRSTTDAKGCGFVFCLVWFFLAFRTWNRDSRVPMLTVMRLKIHLDYRYAFITDSGNTPDTRVWRSPEMHHPFMTRAGRGRGQ